MILIFFSFQNKNEVNEQGKRVLIDEIYYSLFNSNDWYLIDIYFNDL